MLMYYKKWESEIYDCLRLEFLNFDGKKVEKRKNFLGVKFFWDTFIACFFLVFGCKNEEI